MPSCKSVGLKYQNLFRVVLVMTDLPGHYVEPSTFKIKSLNFLLPFNNGSNAFFISLLLLHPLPWCLLDWAKSEQTLETWLTAVTSFSPELICFSMLGRNLNKLYWLLLLSHTWAHRTSLKSEQVTTVQYGAAHKKVDKRYKHWIRVRRP